MNVLVTGGGSGGHMYPALAIAEKFKLEGYNVYYVGGVELESLIWPRNEFPYVLMSARGREFGGIKELLKILRDNIKGVFDAFGIIKKYKPVCVIGTGGYVEVPLIFTAHLMGVPCYIQEQNVIAGRSNLLLERWSKKVFLGFEEASSEFKRKEKLVFSGNPIRQEIQDKNKEESRKKLNLSLDEKIILLTGGSLGAPKINEIALTLAKKIENIEKVRMILSTGKRYGDKIVEELRKCNISFGKNTNIEVYPYIENMADYLASADFVIERSGAISVTETILKGIPSILVPSTYVYKNHQYYNAKAISDKGAAILINENELDVNKTCDLVLDVIFNDNKLKEMSDKAKEIAKFDTLDVIYTTITNDINGAK